MRALQLESASAVSIRSGSAESLCDTLPEFDRGSFRDRTGRVFLQENRVFRALKQRGLNDWQFAESLRFVLDGMRDKRLVPTRLVPFRLPAESVHSGFVSVLEHERLPIITYPYEWCFSMLRSAALLQLSLLDEALAEGAILKDSSAFNIQFCGTDPIFIDLASITEFHEGQLWEGYEQFCCMFLFPLMLQCYRDVDFQPWLRGSLSGISTTQMSGLMSLRDFFRPGVFTHVYLQSKLGRSDRREAASKNHSGVTQTLRDSGFRKSMIQSNVRQLLKIVENLKWSRKESRWSAYDEISSPVRKDGVAKEEFVSQILATKRWKTVWDIGCNLGRYSRLASQHADLVVAMDSDHLTVDAFCRQLQEVRVTNVIPLVMNLADPSPSLGWRCSERSELSVRSQPELIFCLAVIHHLVFRENLILADVLSWLASLKASLIIEYVDRSDPQVRSMLTDRADQFDDYSEATFLEELGKHFEIRARRILPSETRTLYFAVPRHPTQ